MVNPAPLVLGGFLALSTISAAFQLPSNLPEGSWTAVERDGKLDFHSADGTVFEASVPYTAPVTPAARAPHGSSLLARFHDYDNCCMEKMVVSVADARQAWELLKYECTADPDRTRNGVPVAFLHKVGTAVAFQCNWGKHGNRCIYDEVMKAEEVHCGGAFMRQPPRSGRSGEPGVGPPSPTSKALSGRQDDQDDIPPEYRPISPPPPVAAPVRPPPEVLPYPDASTSPTSTVALPTPSANPADDDWIVGALARFDNPRRGYGWSAAVSNEICDESSFKCI